MSVSVRHIAMLVLLAAGCGRNSPITGPPVVNSFIATPSTISLGDATSLSWNVSEATAVAIVAFESGVGFPVYVVQAAGATGSVAVTPRETAVYTLTATNDAGSATASTNVTVTSPLLLGALISPRAGHTATLLPSGRVLLAGGDALGSAELYDASTRQFTATSPLLDCRTDHTATLLQSGEVLVTGGLTTGQYSYSFVAVTSAELYRVAESNWLPLGSGHIGGSGITATLLASGKVLVIGGLWTAGPGMTYSLNTAELYDPSSGSWSTAGSLSTARAGFTATLLASGKVVVAGGVVRETLLSSRSIKTTELYDPSTGTWSTSMPLVLARSGHTATLLATGEVLMAGGEVYSPLGGPGTKQAVAELWSGSP